MFFSFRENCFNIGFSKGENLVDLSNQLMCLFLFGALASKMARMFANETSFGSDLRSFLPKPFHLKLLSGGTFGPKSKRSGSSGMKFSFVMAFLVVAKTILFSFAFDL